MAVEDVLHKGEQAPVEEEEEREEHTDLRGSGVRAEGDGEEHAGGDEKAHNEEAVERGENRSKRE